MEDFQKKLTEDVDVTTMFTMRDRGMANWEIAEALGVSYKTVLKYIGKQPKELNRKRGCGFDPAPKAAPQNPDVMDYKKVEPPTLKVVSTISKLEGNLNTYVIDTGKGSLEISGVVEGLLDQDALQKFIKELSEIKTIFMNVGV